MASFGATSAHKQAMVKMFVADDFDPTLAFTFDPTAYYGTLSGHYELAKAGG